MNIIIYVNIILCIQVYLSYIGWDRIRKKSLIVILFINIFKLKLLCKLVKKIVIWLFFLLIQHKYK